MSVTFPSQVSPTRTVFVTMTSALGEGAGSSAVASSAGVSPSGATGTSSAGVSAASASSAGTAGVSAAGASSAGATGVSSAGAAGTSSAGTAGVSATGASSAGAAGVSAAGASSAGAAGASSTGAAGASSAGAAASSAGVASTGAAVSSAGAAPSAVPTAASSVPSATAVMGIHSAKSIITHRSAASFFHIAVFISGPPHISSQKVIRTNFIMMSVPIICQSFLAYFSSFFAVFLPENTSNIFQLPSIAILLDRRLFPASKKLLPPIFPDPSETVFYLFKYPRQNAIISPWRSA